MSDVQKAIDAYMEYQKAVDEKVEQDALKVIDQAKDMLAQAIELVLGVTEGVTLHYGRLFEVDRYSRPFVNAYAEISSLPDFWFIYDKYALVMVPKINKDLNEFYGEWYKHSNNKDLLRHFNIYPKDDSGADLDVWFQIGRAYVTMGGVSRDVQPYLPQEEVYEIGRYYCVLLSEANRMLDEGYRIKEIGTEFKDNTTYLIVKVLDRGQTEKVS